MRHALDCGLCCGLAECDCEVQEQIEDPQPEEEETPAGTAPPLCDGMTP